MRVLFAAPDRDLTACYRLLLQTPDRQVDTAFDGAQALEKLSQGDWSLAILNRELPRVPCRRLVEQCGSRGIPVILLTDRPPEPRLLPENPPPLVWLPLPFPPSELEALAEGLLEGASPTKAGELE